MAAQNIYDQADFFANYSTLDRSVHGLTGAPEWPRLRSLLPDLAGRRVLDLGCGFGWFCRWAKAAGDGGNAGSVHGVDVSSKMLERARRLTEESGLEGGITYEQADLERFEVPDGEEGVYDVVFSSLALHYLVRLPELLGQVHRALRPGGTFVFSVEHPIFTAPSRPGIVVEEEEEEEEEEEDEEEEKEEEKEKEDHQGDGDREGVSRGKTKGKRERRYWPLDDYQREGLRVTNWLAEGVRKQHRTVGTYVRLLLGAGFELTAFDEWYPRDGELADKPEWVLNEMVKPTFLLVRVVKKD